MVSTTDCSVCLWYSAIVLCRARAPKWVVFVNVGVNLTLARAQLTNSLTNSRGSIGSRSLHASI